MTRIWIAGITVVLLAASALADDSEADRIRALEKRVQELEARLARTEGGAEGLATEMDRYLGESPENATEVLDGAVEAPIVRSNFDLHLGGQIWLLHNVPSSGLGFDTRDRMDLDWLYLYLSGDADPLGFRTWLGFRDSPRYTDASPWGKFFMYEALVTARLPVEGAEISVEAGKVFVPFGVAWDHTWYGSILFYKGSMFDADWGARVLASVPLGEGLNLSGALGWFVRSDELDGASSLAGFGLEGTNFQSPEFTDDTTSPDREQRDQWVFRAALEADLGRGITATLGGSGLIARIRQSDPDGTARLHAGAFAGSLEQKDQEVDLVVGATNLDLGFMVVPAAQLLFEHMWYDRGVKSQKGRAYVAELFLRLYEDPESRWLRAIEVWYNYSADQADGQPDGFLHLPSLGIQINEQVRFIVEYVSFKTTTYTIDRGLYFHLSYDF